MDRPYIICHMLTSLDGKIIGDFWKKSGQPILLTNTKEFMIVTDVERGYVAGLPWRKTSR